MCSYKNYFTIHSGYRPFGSAFLVGGWDKKFGFQLYNTDPGGNYSGWKAYALGTNRLAATSFLKSDYKDDMSLEEGTQLALKALVKTMDTNTPEASKSKTHFDHSNFLIVELRQISRGKDG